MAPPMDAYQCLHVMPPRHYLLSLSSACIKIHVLCLVEMPFLEIHGNILHWYIFVYKVCKAYLSICHISPIASQLVRIYALGLFAHLPPPVSHHRSQLNNPLKNHLLSRPSGHPCKRLNLDNYLSSLL